MEWCTIWFYSACK